MFLCPICKSELTKCENSLKCSSNHSFDYAKSGYVNLLSPGKRNNAKAGDSKEMIRARSMFFESGAYYKICESLCNIISEYKPSLLVDAGCGDGYYTHTIAKMHTGSTVLGFDMSKFGCEHGAKAAKREGLTNVHYSVANIFDLPIASDSADLVISLFAPVAHEEFSRVLKSGGHMIVVSAGIEHLNGLKATLYDNTYPNEEKFLEYKDFELLKIENLKYEATINGNDTIKALFTMTPYYHRTSLSDKQRLDNITTLTTTVEVNLAIYKKINPFLS